MTVHELLVAGRNELAYRGWCAGWYNRGATCLVGAMGITRGYINIDDRGKVVAATELLGDRPIVDACRAMGFSNCDRAMAWNDCEVGKTDNPLATVLERYDAAIAATAPEPEVALPRLGLESERELAGV